MVATFDADESHDYRGRRPAVSFARDHYEGYDAPRLVVRLLALKALHAVIHLVQIDFKINRKSREQTTKMAIAMLEPKPSLDLRIN